MLRYKNKLVERKINNNNLFILLNHSMKPKVS